MGADLNPYAHMWGMGDAGAARKQIEREAREAARRHRARERAEAAALLAKKGGLVALFFLLSFPMYFLIIGSFQDIKGFMRMPPVLVPLEATLNNYARLIEYSSVARWSVNTAIVASVTTAASVLVSCSAGYAFAFFRFPAKRALWLALLVGLMLPRISIIIPQFVVVRQLGMQGTLAATILPLVFAPTGLYLARTFFETVPRSLLESARIEGANEAQVLARVVMPISRPVVAALAVIAAINVLGDLIWQMLVLHVTDRQTLLVGLMRTAFTTGGNAFPGMSPLSMQMTAAVLLMAPLVVVFAVGNRYFTGALGGAVKE